MLKCLTEIAYNDQSLSLLTENTAIHCYHDLTSDQLKRHCEKRTSAAVHSFIYGQQLGGGSLALRANMMSILTSAKVISAKVITD